MGAPFEVWFMTVLGLSLIVLAVLSYMFDWSE